MRKNVFALLLLALFFAKPPTLFASQTYDMSNSANWNIKIIGSTASDQFGNIYKDLSKDINNNGSNDLILCEQSASKNSRTHSGSCYIIFDSLFSSLTGTGNVIDLNNSSSYNIRFDGAAAGDLVGYSAPAVGDINNNGKNDIIIPASGADNTRTGSGSVYVIKDDLLDDYSGTGNNVDLATTSNFNIRYDGATSVDSKNYIGESAVQIKDINGNGVGDIAFSSGHTGIASRARSGSLFIIYDSLHNSYTGTGNIVDLNTSSNYNLVYYNSAMSYFTLLNSLSLEDIDHNGKLDIFVGGGYDDKNSREDSGSAYVIYDSLIDDYSGTGNQIDLTTTSNFNVRIDGPEAYMYLSWGSQAVADMNDNGYLDIVVGTGSTNYNSRSASGSIYVIYDSILSSLSGTGNTLDMSDTSKFNLRFDGPAAGASIGSMANAYDFDNNGRTDLYFGASSSSNNARAQSGSAYVIYDSIFRNYTGTGNLIDLASSDKYSIVYDGSVADDYFGTHTLQADVNSDGSYDTIATAVWADPGGRTDAGEIYITYNFPHTISVTGSLNGSTYSLSGSVSATNSVTTIAGLQYQLDSNSYSGTWTSCDSSDGSYNSRSEAFSCSFTASKGNHAVYLRALDSNGTYTPQSRYTTKTFEIQNNANNEHRKEPKIKKNGDGNNEGGSIQPTTGNLLDQGKKVTVQLQENTFPFAGQLLANTVSGSSLTTATNIDSVQAPTSNESPKLISVAGRSYWQVGSIQQLWYTTYSDDSSIKSAIIIPELQKKSSVMSLSYTQSDLIPAGNTRNPFNPRTLQIAHSLDGKKWTILASVVDEVHSSVGTVGKVGGYYMLVSPIAVNTKTLGTFTKRTLGAQNTIKQPVKKNTQQVNKAVTQKKTTSKPIKKPQSTTSAKDKISNFLQSIFK